MRDSNGYTACLTPSFGNCSPVDPLSAGAALSEAELSAMAARDFDERAHVESVMDAALTHAINEERNFDHVAESTQLLDKAQRHEVLMSRSFAAVTAVLITAR